MSGSDRGFPILRPVTGSLFGFDHVPVYFSKNQGTSVKWLTTRSYSVFERILPQVPGQELSSQGFLADFL